MQQAATTIERTNGVLELARAMLAKGEATLRDAGVKPGDLRARILEKLPDAKGVARIRRAATA